MDEEKQLIGWREYLELPDWGIRQIKAKADTGARSSSIDVANLELIDGDRVRFEVVVDRGDSSLRQVVEADIARRTRVKSSFGDARERIFVQARIRLAGRTLETEVGLMSRKNMLCRMLLGRRCLEKAFLVDPSRCYLHGKKKRRIKKRKS